MTIRDLARWMGVGFVVGGVVLVPVAVFGLEEASAGSSPPVCSALPATIVGTPGDDVLVGTVRSVIVGLGGDDVIRGGGQMCGGPGDDLLIAGPDGGNLIGGQGDDTLRGGRSSDAFQFDRGHDVIFGRGGRADLLTTFFKSGRNLHLRTVTVNLSTGHAVGWGRDVIHGIENVAIECCRSVTVIGNDKSNFIFVGSLVTLVRGKGGIDSLSGGPHPDHLQGGRDRDNLKGRGGPDTLNGGRGADDLDGGSDTDVLIGGRGIDRCLRGETLLSCP